ncbi:GNAT family N-acetyltransferase [Kineosporia sp. NBRC 101731]|uniref:GNAT family N-acetyltransferase n=1 Tax=Kineosporia sp. NBRC 101731 TaxID=3032199 RepID=UPI0024A4D0E8|nr:GNAT family N-acetyltransferase [Kineosporia sp. NBRC 101731]GLY31760.1 N-acetyltransferase [Kineosporia sp. NBRC 101731]
MGEVEIRAAGPADLEGAAACMREVLDRDLGGYQERWHRDIDNLAAAYLEAPRAALFVAVGYGDGEQNGEHEGRVLATTAVRPCHLVSPPNPEWLAARYNGPETCQLVRVWVRSAARRRGLARRLVAEASAWATEMAGYETVYLHTDAGVPGAEAFWRSMPTVEVYDARPDPFNTVHFEIDLPKFLGRPGKEAEHR